MSVPLEGTQNGVHLTSGRLLARNAGLNLGGTLLPAFVALLAVPLLVRGLGDARFGILTLAWTLVGYFSLFDLGIGRAVTHAAADSLGRGDDESLAQVLWTSMAVLIPLGVLGTVLLYVSAPWITSDVLRVPARLTTEVVLTFRVLGVAIPFVGFTAVLRGVLEARQMFGTINALRVPHGVLMFLGPVLALPFSRTLIPAVLILVAGRILLAVGHLVVVARAVPRFSAMPMRWHTARMRELLGFGGWMTVSNVISPIMATLDRFVVAGALGVAVVTYYATPFELVTKLWLFTGGILPVFFPAFVTSAATDRPRTARLFDRVMRLTFAALLLPAVVLVLFAPEILDVWLGGEFGARSGVVLQVLAIAVFVNTVGQCAYTLIQGLGRPDLTGKYHLAELPLYAALVAALLPRYGIVGAATAWALRTVADTVLLLATCPRLLPESRAMVGRMLLRLAVVAAVLLTGAALQSLGARALLGAVLVPLSLVVAWSILTPEERSAPLRTIIAGWRTTSA